MQELLDRYWRTWGEFYLCCVEGRNCLADGPFTPLPEPWPYLNPVITWTDYEN